MRKQNVLLLGISIFALNFGLGVHMSTWMNFLKQALGLPVVSIGVIEGVREVPGLIAVLLVAVLVVLAHRTAAGVCLIVFSVGMAGYFLVQGVSSLIIVSILWSLGFHVWLPFSNSMILDTAPLGREGAHVGKMRSVGYAAMFTGLLMVFALGKLRKMGILPFAPYRPAYLFAGIVGLGGAVACFAIGKDIGKAPPRRMLWRRKYRLYYLLMFLGGCRKQIFMTLATLVLVKIYDAPVHHIAAMMILYNFANWFGAPLLGRAIDHFGERPVLTFNYAGLILVFSGYAVFQQWWALYVLYCIDNLFNIFNMALVTYLKRIAEPEDIAPSLAMGVTANHLASVIAPIFACLAWKYIDYRIPFTVGVMVAACSLVAAQWVRGKT
ncbi:MAG: MFS transporter [Planctomycetes bacterium]|nr:MFS transporter [Planctomycetota bacterium]